MGNAVHGKQVLGEADLGHLDNGDVRSTIDTRCSTPTPSTGWAAPTPDEILGGTFDRHGLVQV